MSGSLIVFACFAGSLVLAHLVGRRVYAALSVAAGHARRVMPTVPSHALETRGPSGAAMRGTIRRIERQLLARFEGGAEGVEAAPLATAIDAPVEWVEIALERLRQEIPCRIRITQTGRMLHDFEAKDVAALTWRKRREKPVRAALFLVATCANAGTIWPVVTVLLLASAALVAMLQAWDYTVGLTGLFLLVGLVVLTLLVGYAVSWLLNPWMKGPQLGPSVPEDARDGDQKKAQKTPASSKRKGSALDVIFVTGDSHAHSSSWSGSSGGSSSSSSSGGSDSSDAGQAILIIVVAIVLLMVIALCLSTVYVWFRGLYRALKREEDLESTAPTTWVRRREWVDLVEKLLPTTDLVGHIWRALRRTLVRRRPVDGEMGRRILARAEQNGGTISSIEIALHEALDPYEAVEAGTRLCQKARGDICVLPHGEVAFTFPEAATSGLQLEDDEHLFAEYLVFSQDGPEVRRAADQPVKSLPVNVVGLREGHLAGSARLVAGSWLMVLFVSFVFGFMSPESLSAYLFDVPVFLGQWGDTWGQLAIGLTVLFAAATTLLATVTHYVAFASANWGVRRDARRAAYQEIMERLRDGHETIDFGAQTRNVMDAIGPAWPTLDANIIAKEMLGVAVDLELEPTPTKGEDVWSLAGVGQRYAEGMSAARALGRERPEPGDEDPVIFDTKVELDRLVSLL